MMTARTRIELMMDVEEREIVSCAAALTGVTMAGFVRAAAREMPLARLDREARVTLSKRDVAAFSKALNGAFVPNRTLKGALTVAKAKVRRV